VYATTFEPVNPGSIPVSPCHAPAKPRDHKEADLVAQLRAGDQIAFHGLVERYESKIHRIAYGILGNREDADEIAQEVFAKVYFSIRQFDARSSLYTWIYRIAVNECYGFLRRKRLKLGYQSATADKRAFDAYASCCRSAFGTRPDPHAEGLRQQTAGSCSGKRPAPAAVERGGGILAGRTVRDDRPEFKHPQGAALSDPSESYQSGCSARAAEPGRR